MKYRPSLPEHNDNISHNQQFKEFLTLLSGLIAIFLIIFWALGFFVDIAVTHITPENEAALFSKFKPVIDLKLKEPSERQADLQAITDSLRECMEVPYPVTVRLAKSEQSNAIAFPGGTVIVLDGLLDKVKSENGIAFVMAHELGHYINRDHLQSMGRQIVLLALSTALTGTNSGISKILANAQAAGIARYSQQQESRADKTALQALNCLYGHTGGATEFFEALDLEEKGFDNKALHYFSTHPELKKRIANINSLRESMGFETKGVKKF
ncbi:MAG: M48 family metallopeptidase [Nitrospira sp.]|nr:M48 family metallopeptidase [bacterium]MBL7048215.1 M48 family metallopeptidase [Nitrospira sp.]